MSELSTEKCEPCQGGMPPMLKALAERMLEQVPRWQLGRDGRQLEREFRFPDFASALAFVNKIGALAEAEGHHPDLELGWGRARVVWYTHKIDGLHHNDFIMAAKVNEIAG